MKKIVYVPVYIDGKEENLPKESGVYFVEKNDFEKGLMYFDPNGKGKLQEYDVLYWMEFARFWLKPTELPDEEEANNKADEMGEREDSNGQKYIDGNYTEGFMDCFKWIIDKLTK